MLREIYFLGGFKTLFLEIFAHHKLFYDMSHDSIQTIFFCYCSYQCLCYFTFMTNVTLKSFNMIKVI